VNRRSALYPAIPPKIRQHGGSPARTKKAALDAMPATYVEHSTALRENTRRSLRPSGPYRT
jgi:hypothetical protein